MLTLAIVGYVCATGLALAYLIQRHELTYRLASMATLGAWGPMAAGFDPEAEADSWRRVESFLRTHLG